VSRSAYRTHEARPGRGTEGSKFPLRQRGERQNAHWAGGISAPARPRAARHAAVDLGRSGGGINRPGFERLLAAICEGRVGAVFAIEASRLARNGRDWHTLIEFCGLVGTVIVDEDGIYDPRHPNDRLLLGMKGTMSELELSLFRQRSHEALKQKARRGALFLGVAAGFVRIGHDRIAKDPDQRVQDALRLVFTNTTS
jgi:DNA invertase Pin-like site-specific DNA recombinase